MRRDPWTLARPGWLRKRQHPQDITAPMRGHARRAETARPCALSTLAPACLVRGVHAAAHASNIADVRGKLPKAPWSEPCPVCHRLTTDAIAVGRRLVWFQCTECRTVWRASKSTGRSESESPPPPEEPSRDGLGS
jgi:hypothetical protein